MRSLPRGVLALVTCLILATVGGMIALWPDGSSDAKLDTSLRPATFDAEIVEVQTMRCKSPRAKDCERVRARLTAGPDKEEVVGFSSGEATADPEFTKGDRIRLAKNEVVEGSPPGVDPYTFSDYDRRLPMIWLLLGFAVVATIAGRLRGMLSLVGLGLSIAIIGAFIVPSILDGRPPLAVAIVGSMAVMFATMGLAHGVGPKSVAAALGTFVSLLLTAALAVLFTGLANISGFSSEEATFLQATGGDFSLEGLVLAGMVIAALGVLDDLTISQSSAVLALRRANPAQPLRELYRAGVGIGRDHVAATVNTLVLAYVGASLPLLLIFSVGDTPFAEAINREAVSVQIIGTLVGSIGLIAAVPLTTLIATGLASREGVAAAAQDAHPHVH